MTGTNETIAQDRVEQEADSIAGHAKDLKEARARQLELEREEAGLNAELARIEQKREELRRRRDEVERDREAALQREREDERLIREDLGDIDAELGGGATPPAPQPGSQPTPHVHFDFYVDGKLYHTELPVMTGRQIKAKVEGWNSDHDLVLEGAGSAEDRVVQDDDPVAFKAAVTLHFSSAPKANFG